MGRSQRRTRSLGRCRSQRRWFLNPKTHRVLDHRSQMAALRSDPATELDEASIGKEYNLRQKKDGLVHSPPTIFSTSVAPHDKEDQAVAGDCLRSRSIELHEKDEEGDL